MKGKHQGCVVRINHGPSHTVGWQARIDLGRFRGRRIYRSKLFSDLKCSGKEKARQLALQWLVEQA